MTGRTVSLTAAASVVELPAVILRAPSILPACTPHRDLLARHEDHLADRQAVLERDASPACST